VPAIIGHDGVERIAEISLSSDEQAALDKSIQAVQELIAASKKLMPQLA